MVAGTRRHDGQAPKRPKDRQNAGRFLARLLHGCLPMTPHRSPSVHLVVRVSVALSLAGLLACGAGNHGPLFGDADGGAPSSDGGGSDAGGSEAGSSEAGSSEAGSSEAGSKRDGGVHEGDSCHASSDCAPAPKGWQLDCVAASDCHQGVPPPSECTTDANCVDAGGNSGRSACAPVTCGGHVCRAPCAGDTACAASEQCDTGGHCVARACVADGQCPKNYACTGGKCARKACTRDDECKGACVNGGCQDHLGQCLGPAA